jgi:hypothetical protein
MSRAMRLQQTLTLVAAAVVWSAGGLAAQGSDALYARFNALSGWEVKSCHMHWNYKR